LRHPPRGADVYVEDEAKLSLFPTLTRMWMRRGQQRKIRAPGVHPPKREEYAATDWRSGQVVRIRALRRTAAAFCQLAEQCLQRSARRKRRVILVVDRARFHRPDTSKVVAELQQRYGRRLTLRYLPTYSPECMPMELLWNDWRDHVTHNHNRDAISDLETDSDRYFAWCAKHPQAVLRTLSSPFAKPGSKPQKLVGFI
jgi:transposase